MKKRKRILALILSLVALLSMMCIPVGAVNTSGYYTSPSCVTNELTVGAAYFIKSSNSVLDNTDVGLYFYLLSSGMPTEFVQDTSRRSYFYLDEDDAPGEPSFVCSYYGTYSFRNGVYGTWNHTRFEQDNPFIIENDNTAELIFEFKVQRISGDKSLTIEKGLVYKVKFWAQ